MEYLESLIKKLELGDNQSLQEIYGNDTQVLQVQALRYIGLLKKYSSDFENDQVSVFSSPGRTEISGNHTDHNHGIVLAGAVDLDNVAVAAKNNSNIIHIHSIGYHDIQVDISVTEPQENELYTSASLVRGVASRLMELGFAVGGFNAVIDGGVPKGSGLSSSASFEVLIGTIISHLFNNGKLDPITNAMVGQYAENNFFGKPCGLMDQTACAVGGFITIDFENPMQPKVEKIGFDFALTGFTLVITDTGGNHANLNDDYASLPTEMKSVASALGATVLREVNLQQIVDSIPTLRKKTGDRAILRAYHFQNENQRVLRQVKALGDNDFKGFLSLVIQSGFSSYMYNQNIFTTANVHEQGVSLGLALSEMVLSGEGAWRVHGGGFAGTIQAFVPEHLLSVYISTLENVFGANACKKLFIRKEGAKMVGI
jgi:galactokinase